MTDVHPNRPEELGAGVRYDADRTYSGPAPDEGFRVLTPAQFEQWTNEGWLVVPDVVPAELCDRVVAMLCDYIDADLDDPSTWYRTPAHSPDAPSVKAISGMVEMYHHPLMWEVRETSRLYDAFVDIWGTEALWVTIDRANVNMPNTEDWHFRGFLHWDIDPAARPIPRNIQGSITLADVGPGSGALQIVPELFQRFDEMGELLAGTANPRLPDATGMEIVEVPSNKGDLVIWDSRMVHGAAANTSDRPRFAQYVAMVPAEPDRGDILELRIRSFENRTAPAHKSMRGHAAEAAFSDAAELSPHGRRLLGLDPWPP